MTRRFGFTLAEVLITLGIIGVVAAMTMPTLINSTGGAQLKVAYKKALSVLNQAAALNLALNDYDFNAATTSTTQATDASVYNLIKSRMNVVRTGTELGYTVKVHPTLTGDLGSAAPTTDYDSDNNWSFFFNDGIAFTFPQAATNCRINSSGVGTCIGLIDVNGQKGPNKQTVCTEGSGDTCEVTSPSDVYPVYFGGGTVTPSTDAGKAVLWGK